MDRRQWLALAGAAMWMGSARAQSAPNLNLVVPVPPGGSVDLTARLLGEHLPRVLKQNVVIENKPGASGSIAAAGVARQAGDANTLMLVFDSHVTNPLVYPNLPYTLKDFTPISQVVHVPNMLVVNNDVPVKNVAELIALMKKNPGKYTFASSGNGTSQHLSGELFKGMAGVDMQHIPYKGSPPALQDVVGGQVTMTFDNITTAWPLAKAGKLRALAVTTAKRSTVAPDVPTLAEAGLPGFEVGSWQGVFAPAGTPPEIVRRLNAEIVKILNLPDVREKLGGLGAEIVADSPEEFAALVRGEVVKWADVVKKSGARVD